MVHFAENLLHQFFCCVSNYFMISLCFFVFFLFFFFYIFLCTGWVCWLISVIWFLGKKSSLFINKYQSLNPVLCVFHAVNHETSKTTIPLVGNMKQEIVTYQFHFSNHAAVNTASITLTFIWPSPCFFLCIYFVYPCKAIKCFCLKCLSVSNCFMWTL